MTTLASDKFNWWSQLNANAQVEPKTWNYNLKDMADLAMGAWGHYPQHMKSGCGLRSVHWLLSQSGSASMPWLPSATHSPSGS